MQIVFATHVKSYFVGRKKQIISKCFLYPSAYYSIARAHQQKDAVLFMNVQIGSNAPLNRFKQSGVKIGSDTDDKLMICFFFYQKQKQKQKKKVHLTSHANCFLRRRCMKYQSLFSGEKIRKISSVYRLLILPREWKWLSSPASHHAMHSHYSYCIFRNIIIEKTGWFQKRRKSLCQIKLTTVLSESDSRCLCA